ncbi:hypothetical protein [Saccharothrix algeriensis]|uniref:Secreted protein n=1 Tax=Saccharothrix algeriensis TaxID=173560 RepID=A0A8T8HS43_9PSEU|nr:hypothetical protein [Saccharothrix algeriensis]MBM7812601.1 hypothetical protein [Saccharothrix algeriensis]QTR01316.1 hypothetical protein J7S33_17825 [Saccharothrix algeriensis]
MGKFIGFLALAWLGLATAVWTAPVGMTHSGGAVPEQEAADHPCAFDEAGMANCPDTSSYLWRLPAHGERTVTTTWEPSRSDIRTVTGTLTHENPDCPGSRISWTVVTDERTGGTLTDDDRQAELDIPVQRPLRRITLTLRREDAAACASALRWTDPRLEPPYALLP